MPTVAWWVNKCSEFSLATNFSGWTDITVENNEYYSVETWWVNKSKELRNSVDVRFRIDRQTFYNLENNDHSSAKALWVSPITNILTIF